MKWLVAPVDQGQAVEVSFAFDENGWYRKTRDRSLPSTHRDAIECHRVS
jgi:hypothetical protein